MARLLAVAMLMAMVCLPAAAQEDPATIMKNIQKAIAEGKGHEAKSQYCTASAPTRIQKYCANAIDGDIKVFEDGERSQLPQGKSLFNSGDYVRARNLFTSIKSGSLQAEKNKWLGYIDKMEKGKAAAQAGRASDAGNNLRAIINTPDPEIGPARATASQFLDAAFQQSLNNAKGALARSDFDGTKKALADANSLKPNDPQIGQVQRDLDAKMRPAAPPQVQPQPQPPAQQTVVAKNDPQQLKVLADAIKSYYARDYDGADKKLSDFISSNMASPKVTPRVEGLAYFYRGASRLAARAVKGQTNPESAATDDFHAAKQRWLAAPPAAVQQNVSPRILSAYNGA